MVETEPHKPIRVNVKGGNTDFTAVLNKMRRSIVILNFTEVLNRV
jgi:hypothetical protein